MKKPSGKRKGDYFAQALYFHDHPNCQVCGKTAVHVHEIIFRSEGGKCEEDNMISLCISGHVKSHFLMKPYLHKYDLWKAKGLDIERMREKYLLARSGWKMK